jgi:hypothetical protein
VLGAVFERIEAQFRALKIGQNANRPTKLLLRCPDHGNLRAHTIMRGMAHIDPENVNAREK